MSIRKLIKRIIFLFNPKSLLIGLLMSFIFFTLNTTLNDIFTFIIVSILFCYLCVGLAYRVYQYFKKDHILMNVLILFLLSGISSLVIDVLLKHQQDIPFLLGFKGDLIIAYTLIALIAFVLVLVKLIFNFIFILIKRKIDTFKLVLAVIFLLTSIFIFYPPVSIENDTVKFYYQTLNPKAGMIYYEKQYKDETATAEGYRTQVNNIMSELQENGQAQKSDEYLLTLLKGKKTNIDDIFRKRDESLKRLIDLDKLGLKIRLSKEQKQFYEKRKSADENELKAFSLYKLAQERFTNGSIAFYGFWNLFHTAINSAFSPDQTVPNTDTMAKIEKQINNFYGKEIKDAVNNKILSENIIKQIDHGCEVLTKLFEYQKFSLTKPSSESLREKEQELLTVIQDQGSSTDSNTDMFMDWVDTFVKPGIYLQDKEHQRSFNYFKDAYDYAKKQKMDAIFTVWKNDYPGYEKPQQEPVTLKNSKEAVDGYYKIYENQMVKYIRTALNAYLDQDPQNIISKAVKEKDEDNNYIYGLDSFDKEYYKSRFVVILKEDFPFGGNQFTIMFQDRPDKFFTAWVYEKPDKSYELRGFSSAKKQRQEDIDKVNTEFKDFLMDKVHSL